MSAGTVERPDNPVDSDVGSRFKTRENHDSGVAEITIPESSESRPSNKDHRNIDLRYTENPIHPGWDAEGMSDYERYRLTNEADDFYEVYTFNSALKKKLAAYARKHPELCSLKETTKEGSATYVVDKDRLLLRLTELYSEARRQAASEKGKEQGLGGKTAD